MESVGLLSVLPPVMAIALALYTRQVFLSLLAGIWLGFTILADWNPFYGTLDTLEGLANVFSSNYNTKIVIFTLVIGGLIALTQRSGGVDGFVRRILKYLDKESAKATTRGQRKKVEILALLTGTFLFIESNISILTVGTLYRPVFDRLKIPREKLAYIADSTSAPSCILFPFNAWGAFIIGHLATLGLTGGFNDLFKALIFNFYPMLVIIIMLYVILSGRDIGEMKSAEVRAAETGKLIRDGAQPMVGDEALEMPIKKGAIPKARNMIIPILSLVALVPTFLIMTGWEAGKGDVFLALREGSGGSSILYASSFACIIAALMYKLTGTLRIRESFDTFMKGMGALLPLAILMVLAFAIGNICNDLGTGDYVAEQASKYISPALVPALIFVITCFIAFSTGTSWGTFAIMLAIAVPLAQTMDTNVSLAIAAVLGGGIFGDHCSPTSDTSIISSMASASDHIDHIRTQLPYALIGGVITFVLYLILGFAGI
ncbi:MAG: sodium:solute symporter [Hellea sp.]|nr:sodium:solute symporter [Hellea sp.]